LENVKADVQAKMTVPGDVPIPRAYLLKRLKELRKDANTALAAEEDAAVEKLIPFKPEAATTGLIVDIRGTGPVGDASNREVKVIALRADLDGLPIQEGNSGLEHRSQNKGVAHLCGHDGHMAALMGVAYMLGPGGFNLQAKIPEGCTVRLLFQPAEEGAFGRSLQLGYDISKSATGGAVPLIQDGALKGVHEVYGLSSIARQLFS